MREKCNFVNDLTQEDEDFLQNLPFTISVPSFNVLVVHGGLLPGIPIEQQDPLGMMFIRNYVPEKFKEQQESRRACHGRQRGTVLSM